MNGQQCETIDLYREYKSYTKNKDIIQSEEEYKESNIQCPIQLILGTVEIKLDNLLEMQKGEILDFEYAENSTIDLCFLGEKIGEGILIEEEGKTCIQILEITNIK